MISTCITYRRNRKLQAGGNYKNPYYTCVANSHYRPLHRGTPISIKPADTPAVGQSH